MTFGLGATRSVALNGLDGRVVDVEAHIGQGLPHFAISGLADRACAQAPDRIRPAATSSEAPIPPHRVVVNLSPAAISKHGTAFDVAITIAVLAAAGTIPGSAVREVVHLGELGLDGRIRPVRGVLPSVLAAKRAGVAHVVVPPGNVAEARLVEGIEVHAAPDLRTLLGWYEAQAPLPEATWEPRGVQGRLGGADLADLAGQAEARLALELAAAGGHHLLFTGPPGSGKTMLAERLVSILPELGADEALEVHAIKSLTGHVGEPDTLDRTPPFVAPHHSASVASVVGGGSGAILPGAISRAHHGVLFLDEAAEFKTSVLQTLRQPLESGEVVIARAHNVVCYPARFQLVLAANPCPCGQRWGKGARCTCAPREVRAYASRLSGPLLDRVDLQVTVPPVQRSAFAAAAAGESSEVVAARVAKARAAQAERWRPHGWATNSLVPGHVLRKAPYRLPEAATTVLDRALDRSTLSLRGYDRVLRAAWTLADYAGREVPGPDEVATALGLRTHRSAA